jgi:hypothetical protein
MDGESFAMKHLIVGNVLFIAFFCAMQWREQELNLVVC